MSQPQQDTPGDYGYDLAHEAADSATGSGPAGSHPRHAVVHPGGTADLSEDHGYDEAHSF